MPAASTTAAGRGTRSTASSSRGSTAEGLTPAPEADRRALIRRATFDLTGLPPTPEEVDAFLADHAPTAYERLVDRLLASPALRRALGPALARPGPLRRVRRLPRGRATGPTPGATATTSSASFNDDKPYDRFVTEQLAGDELDPDDPELLIATGFLRHWHLRVQPARRPRASGRDILNDITDVTGDVFLGLGIGCARCHDHKFDPILQKDYYRLQAFFAPLLPRDDLIAGAAAEQRASTRRRLAALGGRDGRRPRGRSTRSRSPSATGRAGRDDRQVPRGHPRRSIRKPAGERTPLEQQLADLAIAR